MGLGQSIGQAILLIVQFDAQLWEIILLSLFVSLLALLIAGCLAIIVALYVATHEFTGKTLVILCLNAMMSLPPVFIGLMLYMIFSRSGVFGFMQLLYSPTIMIMAQTLLIFPIIAALAVEILQQGYQYYRPLLWNLPLSWVQRVRTLLYEMRVNLLIILVAGLGRALSEVGAVIIVGGNIQHYTRTMTTSIVLETSKGNIAFAFALGLILVVIAMGLNALLLLLKHRQQRKL